MAAVLPITPQVATPRIVLVAGEGMVLDQEAPCWPERAEMGPSELPPDKRRRTRSYGFSRKSPVRILVAVVVVFAFMFAGLGILRFYSTLAKDAAPGVNTFVSPPGTVQPATSTGSQPTTTTSGQPSPVITAPPGMTLYTNADYGFSFAYPETWKPGRLGEIVTGNEGQVVAQVTFGDPRSVDSGLIRSMVIVWAMPLIQAPAVPLPAWLNQQIERWKTQVPDLQVIAPASSCTINGVSGAKITYAATLGGHPVVAETYMLFSEDLHYQINVQADKKDWQKEKPLFDATALSFHIPA
jgi:hypothetical protein